MRVLLINPPFNHSHQFLAVNEPLGLAYLAAKLREHNYQVEILDAVAEGGIYKQTGHWRYGLSENNLFKRIAEKQPDIVGVTCLFSRFKNDAQRTIDLAKQVNQRIITVAGGVHFSIFPKETMEDKNVDFVIMGEGEESFLKLIKQIEAGNNDYNINGCAFRINGEIKLMPKNNFIADLDALPLPARDLLPMDFYFKNDNAVFGVGRKRNALLLTSRSCPNRCSFCAINLIQGRGFRARSAENVFEEIQYLIENYQVGEFSVIDDNLTFDKNRILAICDLIIKNNLRIKWNTPNGVHINHLDREVLMMMKKAGCVNIGVGIESGDEYVRSKLIGKYLPTDKIFEVLRICREINLPVIGFFVIGFPREKSASFLNTIDLIRKIPLNMISVSFATPYPGTALYEECLRDNYIKEQDYLAVLNGNKLNYDAPMIETKNFDKNFLRQTRKKMYLEFILSHWPRVLWQTILGQNYFLTLRQIGRFFTDNFLKK